MRVFTKNIIKFLFKKSISLFLRVVYLTGNNNINRLTRILRYILQRIEKYSDTNKNLHNKNVDNVDNVDNELINLSRLQYQKKDYAEAAQTISWLKNYQQVVVDQTTREICEINDDANLFNKFFDLKLSFLKPLNCTDSSTLKSVEYIEIAPAEELYGTAVLKGFPDINIEKVNQTKVKTFPHSGCIVRDCMVFPRSTSIFTSEGELINDKASHELSQKNLLILEKPILGHFSKGLAINKNQLIPTLNLDKAIHLLINNSRGWGHWHYFNLPRIEFLLNLKLSKDIPVLIDKGLPQQAKQSLNLYFPDHPIIEVDYIDRVHVKELYYPREASFTPGFLKVNADINKMKSVVTTSYRALKFLRSMAISKAKRENIINGPLYLSRKYTTRRLLSNRKYLDDLMTRNNFTEIFLEKLDFDVQISSTVFAKKILAQMGSAADYIINQSENSKSLIITGEETKTWNKTHNSICSFGIDCRYLLAEYNHDRLGQDYNRKENAVTFDLEINEKKTLEAIKWLVQ